MKLESPLRSKLNDGITTSWAARRATGHVAMTEALLHAWVVGGAGATVVVETGAVVGGTVDGAVVTGTVVGDPPVVAGRVEGADGWPAD
jgi:hypothetical protein